MPVASFTVEVAWESAVTLVFKLDVSTLDSGSVLDGGGNNTGNSGNGGSGIVIIRYRI